MRTNGKILLKVALLIGFLYITPFFSGIGEIMKHSGFLDAFVYRQHSLDESISIKDEMNLFSHNANLTIQDDFKFQTTQEPMESKDDKAEDTDKTNDNKSAENQDKIDTKPKNTDQKEEKKPKDTGKTVYIYNTHQSEEYEGGETVMDAAAVLGNELEERGIHVVLETANFAEYLKAKGLDYNASYEASRNFMNDALVNYGGFDLIIDLHRDAIPREVSYLKANGKTYAKMMPVIGGLSKNADVIKKNSSTLSDIIDSKVHGIMRSTMVREAYYNQSVSDRMMLIECGGDVNPFNEVKNSMEILADGIYDYLMR
ncbi:MAG: stage II sporulation protein P [Erysipelotrichaceae bacterium]|nr:stage II sporulation protein P [Erysipelotrichaceae bacterium]